MRYESAGAGPLLSQLRSGSQAGGAGTADTDTPSDSATRTGLCTSRTDRRRVPGGSLIVTHRRGGKLFMLYVGARRRRNCDAPVVEATTEQTIELRRRRLCGRV